MYKVKIKLSKIMEKKYKILGVITVYVLVVVLYVLFLAQFVPYLNFIVIGSLSVVSAGTIYAIIHESGNLYKREKKRKLIRKSESKPKELGEIPRKTLSQSSEIIDEYFETFPYVEDYIESEESHEQVPIINEVIFSGIEQELLNKIDLLDLSKMDKLQFIRELIYYEPEERENLIESMLINRNNIDGEVIYSAPTKILEISDKFRVHVISLVEAGEKKKIIIIESLDSIIEVKNQIAILFDYNIQDFLLSSGGIILDEKLRIKDYFIEDDDEIVLIPVVKKE